MSLKDEQKQMIAEMLDLQNQLNLKVNPLWRTAGNAWYRAIWVECAEMMDHFGWKWWKKQDPDVAQVHLELVDIWHFGLSDLIDKSKKTVEEYIESDGSILATIYHNAGSATIETTDDAKRFAIEVFAKNTISMQGFPTYAFFLLMKHFNLTLETLYEQCIGKNVLNIFRQDHGYKTGEYKKIWHGREDNEVLVEVIAELKEAGALNAGNLHNQLSAIYATVV